jgi:hypothetical protein
LIELDTHLLAIVEEHKPIGVRGSFYRAEVMGLVPKEERSVRLIGRRLLKLRRQGIIPYSWIVDESREVYGQNTYGNIGELSEDVPRIYRRDYWRDTGCWVQIWVEKRGLVGVIQPVVVERWRLNLCACAGQPSESYLFRAGRDIEHRGVETYVYVLSDFDPAGHTIFKTLDRGTKDAPGGLSRFTGGIPVYVHKLALSQEQVCEWNLPTRPAKRSDPRAARFIQKHGDLSVELDAIPPNDLRQLVDDAISQHLSQAILQARKAREALERAAIDSALDGARWDLEEFD